MKTNLSDDLQVQKLTPDKKESESVEERKLSTTARNWERAAKDKGLITRASSLPEDLNKLEDNFWLAEFKSRQKRMRSLSTSDLSVPSLNSCTWSVEKITNLTMEAHGGKNDTVDGGLEEVNRTPKSKLQISTQTPSRLEGKLERISIDQAASPTLRKPVGSTVTPLPDLERSRCQTLDPSCSQSLRKKLLGRRRIASMGDGEKEDGNTQSDTRGARECLSLKDSLKDTSMNRKLNKPSKRKKTRKRIPAERDESQPLISDALTKHAEMKCQEGGDTGAKSCGSDDKILDTTK